MIRHGDVQLIPVKELPNEVKLLNGRNELAYGEVTGHAHRIDTGELFETKQGELYLKVEKLSNLTHEEHKTLVLDPGIYRVIQKRQYSPEGWEKVRD